MTDTKINIENVLNERGATHGSFALQGTLSVELKEAIQRSMDLPKYVLKPFEHQCSYPQLEAIHMILHKIARIVAGDARFQDHWVDIIGYATLGVNHPNYEPVEDLGDLDGVGDFYPYADEDEIEANNND